MTSRAYSPPETTRSKGPLLLLVGVLVVLAALLPLAMMLDRELDHERLMYSDRQDVAWLEHLAVAAGLEPVTGTVTAGETLVFGEEEFTPSEGVTVEVRREDGEGPDGEVLPGYCVRSSNEDGEATPWLCHDSTHPPAKPTGDPLSEI
jgi:hypothetical protein